MNSSTDDHAANTESFPAHFKNSRATTAGSGHFAPPANGDFTEMSAQLSLAKDAEESGSIARGDQHVARGGGGAQFCQSGLNRLVVICT